jgi:drug/metabolite transporter (DMT)-like permease
MASRALAPTSSTPTVPIRSGPRGKTILVLAVVAGLIGLVVYVRARFSGPLYGMSQVGWVVLGLVAFVLGTVVVAFRKEELDNRWAVALILQAVAAALLVSLLSQSPTPPGVKPAARPAHRQAAVLAAGCPGFGKDPVGFVRCAWAHAGDKAKGLSPTTTTTPRRKT